jgi:glycerate-2-kinase
VEEAAHPVPDARGERAAREMLDLARGRALDDLALVLVSGGGSALTACPDGELTLDDVAAVTEALLRSGADIRELNCVRKHLSAFAGGRLAQALGASRSLTLAVSDVVGDDPSTIASGPTVPDPTTYAEALAVLESRLPAEALPAPVLRHLAEGAAGRMAETPAGSELPEERHRHVVIASAARALESADRRLGALGFEVTSLGADMSADAAAVAADHVARLVALHAGSRRPVALVRAGETTVRVTGSGTGGRNQHLAASAAASLDALGPTVPGELVVVAFATDGTDGPTDAAGGIVDRGSWKRVLASGADPARRLADFDSNAFLRASGDLILTGPTGTNVMDLVLGLAARAPPSR